jgi:glycosyltransferase involved in cell wall biosynthesis
MGSVPGAHHEYVRSLRSAASSAIDWAFDLSFTGVAEILAASFAAYLPFPDGASERRGSLLAALTNGLPVLSTLGDATSPELQQVILPTANPAQALLALDELDSNPEHAQRLGVASRTYAQKYSWSSIANQHRNIYRELALPHSPNQDESRSRELRHQSQDLRL